MKDTHFGKFRSTSENTHPKTHDTLYRLLAMLSRLRTHSSSWYEDMEELRRREEEEDGEATTFCGSKGKKCLLVNLCICAIDMQVLPRPTSSVPSSTSCMLDISVSPGSLAMLSRRICCGCRMSMKSFRGQDLSSLKGSSSGNKASHRRRPKA